MRKRKKQGLLRKQRGFTEHYYIVCHSSFLSAIYSVWSLLFLFMQEVFIQKNLKKRR